MKEEIRKKIAAAIADATEVPVEECFSLLEAPKSSDHGDLAFPCFQLARTWKTAPPVCAKTLREKLQLPPEVESATETGPFLNFRFHRARFATGVLTEISTKQERHGVEDRHAQTIIVEYSSPNIAKPFHVGHLRTTLIGNSLDRVLRHRGYNVISINHLGDWGTQFGFVWAGCKLWGKPETDSVAGLVDRYIQATTLKAEQEKEGKESEEGSVNEMARKYFLDLENNVPYAREFWQWCLDISLEYFRTTYERLNVRFDHYTGESFYSDKLDAVRTDLDQAGVLSESQGALGVDLEKLGLGDLGFARIYTPDGRSLYLARDIATAKYRHETFRFDRALYIVGATQSLHFKQIVGVLKAMKAPYADRIAHIPFGTVLGMSTRSGGAIELNRLLEEAKSRALTAYREEVTKRPAGLDEELVAETVGLAATAFGTLSRQRNKDVEFSWENALSFQGDSGPYLLYAYARLNGIEEKAREAGVHAASQIDGELLREESAFALVKMLDEFVPTLDHVIDDSEPSYLASYGIDLARAFSKAYLELKVLGAEPALAAQRLALFRQTKTILGLSLQLLGLRLCERM